MWDWVSLDILYYPVSAVLWFWYKVFGWFLGPANFLTWALAVVFLVITLRAIFYPTYVKQVRTMRKMRELQPQIRALQRWHGEDRQRMAIEMQRLQRQHSFHPMIGCLPVLFKVLVFIALIHVLLSFNRTVNVIFFHFFHYSPKMSVAANRATANYIFSPTDVGNFLDANLLGAPLSAFMMQTSGLEAFTEFDRSAVIAVAVPMLVLAALTNFQIARATVARQSPEVAAHPQTATMNRISLYIFPLAVLAAGPWLLVGNVIYILANNFWTFGEQHYVYSAIDSESPRI